MSTKEINLSLNPQNLCMQIIWNLSADVIKDFETTPTRFRVDLKYNDICLYKKSRGHRHRGRRPHTDGGGA